MKHFFYRKNFFIMFSKNTKKTFFSKIRVSQTKISEKTQKKLFSAKFEFLKQKFLKKVSKKK